VCEFNFNGLQLNLRPKKKTLKIGNVVHLPPIVVLPPSIPTVDLILTHVTYMCDQKEKMEHMEKEQSCTPFIYSFKYIKVIFHF
jgi:hypothetical protein